MVRCPGYTSNPFSVVRFKQHSIGGDLQAYLDEPHTYKLRVFRVRFCTLFLLNKARSYKPLYLCPGGVQKSSQYIFELGLAPSHRFTHCIFDCIRANCPTYSLPASGNCQKPSKSLFCRPFCFFLWTL